MNKVEFSFAEQNLSALPSGALWWPERQLLCVSDLHLGKSERMARRGGAILPPYESQDTLDRLAADLERTGAATVICLGDSFDDLDFGDSEELLLDDDSSGDSMELDIDADESVESIQKALAGVTSPSTTRSDHPYGDGTSGPRIANYIAEVLGQPGSERLVRKRCVY